MRALTRLLVLCPLLVAVAACGSDGDSSDEASNDAAEATAPEPADGSDDTTSDPAGESDDATSEPADESVAPPAAGGGGATLTLANGETFEFATVLCSLEPQTAAGSEILFTATSYDDPGLDITQFGDEGTITGVASISVYDGNFETLWEANSMFGSPVELTWTATRSGEREASSPVASWAVRPPTARSSRTAESLARRGWGRARGRYTRCSCLRRCATRHHDQITTPRRPLTRK